MWSRGGNVVDVRIAMITSPWVAVPPEGYGGTELVVDGLCRALSDAGHEVLLCATGDSACPVQRAWTFDAACGTDHIDPELELRHVISAYADAVAWGADIVHDHTMVGPYYAAGHVEVPVVTTAHGPLCGPRAALYRDLAPRVPVIAISHDQRARAGSIPVRAVIHHGLDIDRYPVGGGDGGYAAFLGRMSPDKGVVTAIEVARAAQLPLRIAAKMREPDEQAFFAAHVEPLLGDGVEYLGEVAGEAKLRLLAGALCLLNPICWPEPFGMVMIESLACATPVVATPYGAAPEIVDDGVTGYVAHGIDKLALAVVATRSLPRASCRDAVAARFSTAHMAAGHVRLYAQLVSRVTGARAG
jgi:glycosyltransferase involved in cell wall biosynthesis